MKNTHKMLLVSVATFLVTSIAFITHFDLDISKSNRTDLELAEHYCSLIKRELKEVRLHYSSKNKQYVCTQNLAGVYTPIAWMEIDEIRFQVELINKKSVKG